ncbi:hypothetical protein LTS18_013972, partial [Coniosporium uncinatum]
ILYGRRDSGNSVTPFDEPSPGPKIVPPFVSEKVSDSSAQSSSDDDGAGRVDFEDNAVMYCDAIPAAFGERVFDEAEKEIKYLVLTNTWPKYVQEACVRGSEESRHTPLGKAKKRWRSLPWN